MLFPLHTLLLPAFSCMDFCYLLPYPDDTAIHLLYPAAHPRKRLVTSPAAGAGYPLHPEKSHIWAFLAGAMAAYNVCERLA